MKARYLITLFVLLAALGCGGSGGPTVGENAFAGTYRSDFTRAADTSMYVFSNVDGSATFVVSAATGVLFSGAGTLDAGGGLSGTATGTGGNITLSGTFVGPSSPTGVVNVTGDLTENINVTRVALFGDCALAGTYTLTYSGQESGSGSVTISSRSLVNANITSPAAGSLLPSTSLGDDGSVTLTATGATTPTSYTFRGQFFFVPGGVQGRGTWSSTSGLSGTWIAQ
jgi:hypothetical protein